jgi:hypothetical protein
MASRSNKTVRYAQPAMVSSAPKTPPKTSVSSAIRSVVASQKPKSSPLMTQRKPMPYMTGTDKNGNRLGPRPKLGEADPATRRAALDAALRPGPPVKPAAPKPAPAPLDGQGGPGNQRRRRVIDETVDRMSR